MAVFDRLRDRPYQALSEAKKGMKLSLNHIATVDNGARLNRFLLRAEREDY